MDWLRSLPTFPEVGSVVVVDGGGTGSRAALAADDGRLVAYAEGGPTNSRSVGDEEAAANVGDLIARVVCDAGPLASAVTSVLVSSASVDTQAHAEVLARGVRTAVPAGATVAVVADTLGCWAATAALAPAVAVIAGTGSSVLAASLEQGSRRYGGWDYVLGDEGSGFALGRAALRETLLVSEGSSPATDLAAVCRSRLGIAETDELFDAIYKPAVDKAEVASFAALVLDLAAAGDPASLRIVGEQSGLLADTVARAFRDYADLATLGCFGGIWKAEIYRSLFADALATRVATMPRIVHPGDVAMAGAYRLVLRHRAGTGSRAGEAEDRSVDRFAAALVAAKEASVS